MSEALEARIRELEADVEKWIVDRDAWIARYEDVKAELEARKKAWEELDGWLDICGVDTGGGECDGMVNPGSVKVKMRSLEATLPKGGA